MAGAVLALATGCDVPGTDGPAEPVVAFDTATITIETGDTTLTLRAELARTPEQRAHGLMERASLPQDAGMLFLYPQPQDSTSGFWMFRTRIPLDIAFLDDDGRIIAIRSMVPCGSPNPRVCPVTSPGRPYSGALEVNRGYFEERGVEVGDRVVPPTDAEVR